MEAHKPLTVREYREYLRILTEVIGVTIASRVDRKLLDNFVKTGKMEATLDSRDYDIIKNEVYKEMGL